MVPTIPIAGTAGNFIKKADPWPQLERIARGGTPGIGLGWFPFLAWFSQENGQTVGYYAKGAADNTHCRCSRFAAGRHRLELLFLLRALSR